MRVIYSLRLDLDPGRPGTTLHLIAPVDGTGRSRICRPLNPRKRLVDLVNGDHILYCGKVRRIQGVEPYRWHEVSDEFFRSRTDGSAGFVAIGDLS
jgi:hypothetical protein